MFSEALIFFFCFSRASEGVVYLKRLIESCADRKRVYNLVTITNVVNTRRFLRVFFSEFSDRPNQLSVRKTNGIFHVCHTQQSTFGPTFPRAYNTVKCHFWRSVLKRALRRFSLRLTRPRHFFVHAMIIVIVVVVFSRECLGGVENAWERCEYATFFFFEFFSKKKNIHPIWT